MNKDLELLRSLYCIHSPSGREKKMRKFLRRYCSSLGAEVSHDAAGNLYVTKGVADTYPCIVAHMDQVQEQHSKDFAVFMHKDTIFGFSAKSRKQQGLGADDKNGLWVALSLLKEKSVLKCAFFVSEEVGCVGSSQANMEFFNNVRFCLQPDRRGGGDLITSINYIQICSDEFLNDIPYEAFGYTPTNGLMTDVEALLQNGLHVACINFSCGYYHPHTDQEVTSWSELCNALDFASEIVDRCEKVYEHQALYGGYNNRYTWYDDWLDYGYKLAPEILPKSRIEYLNSDAFNEDYVTMYNILCDEGLIPFRKVLKDYRKWFCVDDENLIREVYEDVTQLQEFNH